MSPPDTRQPGTETERYPESSRRSLPATVSGASAALGGRRSGVEDFAEAGVSDPAGRIGGRSSVR